METLKEPYGWKRILVVTAGAIGFISALLSFYVFFFQEKKVSLDFEVISNTNVLDINANLSKLDIIYNGESLKSNKQNLRIFTIRVKNSGNESILKGYYDLNDPIGLELNGSKIVEVPEIISTSNNYIKKNLKIRISNNTILFNDLILEPDESFTIKLLVLHGSNVNPKVVSTGKIAGQNNIPIIHLEGTKENTSFFKDLFINNITIQTNRLLFYGMIMIIIIVISIQSTQKLSEIKEKRNKIS